jgi:hypothetical protein
MTYYSCAGCQWEETCEFSCPCEYYCGDCETDDMIDYAVSAFEMIAQYQDIENDYKDGR